MLLYPTIEILDGRCVSLTRADMDQPAIWHVNPVEKAREFSAAGAEWMHLTDFNAIQGNHDNDALVLEIIRKGEIAVQLAGGMRTQERIEHWLDVGAGRIVVGTLATQNPALVKRLARQHPDSIVLAVDVLKGHVMVDGWKRRSAFEASDFLNEFSDAPLAGVLVTDIAADMGDHEDTLSLISRLAHDCRSPVIASGIVRTIDDISRLKYVRNVSGAIVGRALFNRTIDLNKAIRTASAGPEAVAEFV